MVCVPDPCPGEDQHGSVRRARRSRTLGECVSRHSCRGTGSGRDRVVFHSLGRRRCRIAAALTALALATGCAGNYRLLPRHAADDGLTWLAPAASKDLRSLDRWRQSVGPALVVNKSSPAVDRAVRPIKRGRSGRARQRRAVRVPTRVLRWSRPAPRGHRDDCGNDRAQRLLRAVHAERIASVVSRGSRECDPVERISDGSDGDRVAVRAAAPGSNRRHRRRRFGQWRRVEASSRVGSPRQRRGASAFLGVRK